MSLFYNCCLCCCCCISGMEFGWNLLLFVFGSDHFLPGMAWHGRHIISTCTLAIYKGQIFNLSRPGLMWRPCLICQARTDHLPRMVHICPPGKTRVLPVISPNFEQRTRVLPVISHSFATWVSVANTQNESNQIHQILRLDHQKVRKVKKRIIVRNSCLNTIQKDLCGYGGRIFLRLYTFPIQYTHM